MHVSCSQRDVKDIDEKFQAKELDEIISPSTVTMYNNDSLGKIAVNEKCDKFKMIVARLVL